MISIYFGSPGAGKTTIAARMLYKAHKRSLFKKVIDFIFKREFKPPKFYSNFPLKGAHQISPEELGEFAPEEGSIVMWDEAGIDFNNRKYKSTSQKLIEFLKLHRHYKIDIVFFSQAWNDVEITIRRLADKLMYIKKFGPFTMARRIIRFVFMDELQHQITDGYKFDPLWNLLFTKFPFFFPSPFFIFFRPPYYHMFDSYSKPYKPPLRSEVWSREVLPKNMYYYSFKSMFKNIFKNRKGGR